MLKSGDILVLPSALEAVSRGDVAQLQSLLSHVTDVDIVNEVLYACAKEGIVGGVKFLLSKGGDANAWQPSDDETPLSVASGLGHAEIVRVFLEHGCDVNFRCSGEMHTALHSSCSKGQVACTKLLLDSGADCNIKDCFATTALIKACKAGHAQMVRLLLERGADASIKNIKKDNAFIIALYEHRADCVEELLLARPDFYTDRTPDGLLPLTQAIRFRDEALVGAFVNAGCDLNVTEGLLLTPLQLAIETGHIPTINALLKGGCQMNASLGLPTGATPLMLAVCKGRPDIVKALIDNGCLLDQFDRHGRTALYLAVKHGYLQCVHMLLRAGADPDGYMYDEMQPEYVSSHNALQSAILNNRPEETLALIQSGCNLFQGVVYEDAQGHGSFTPFQCALGRDCRWAVKMLAHANPSVIRSIEPYSGSDEEIKLALERALELNTSPKPLKMQCRMFVRDHLGGRRLFAKVPLLSLPLPLADYLLFKDLEYFV